MSIPQPVEHPGPGYFLAPPSFMRGGPVEQQPLPPGPGPGDFPADLQRLVSVASGMGEQFVNGARIIQNPDGSSTMLPPILPPTAGPVDPATMFQPQTMPQTL
jgi:hypothetical protein